MVRQGNDHYVYPDVAAVSIPKRVSDINNYQRRPASQDRGLGGVQNDRWVHTRMCGPCLEQ